MTVTVGSYQPGTTRSVSLSRPMSVLEEEITGDIYTCASDDDEPLDGQSQAAKSTVEPQHQPQSLRESSNRPESKTLNLETRLPGQVSHSSNHKPHLYILMIDSNILCFISVIQQCKCPNRVAYKHDVSGHLRSGAGRSQYGSMVAKFSSSGSLLAFHCTTYMRANHEIIILKVNNLQISHTLVGHLSIVYDLDWLSENVLASVSSDRTAIVWFLTENAFHMKVRSAYL